jgi:hypothetical protein
MNKNGIIKNGIKKIIYILPFAIVCVLVVGILTGKLDNFIKKINDSSENKTVKEVNLVYKDGKLQLRESFDDWEIEPLVDEYDPDNKIAKNNAYGVTTNEYDWRHNCDIDTIQYDSTVKLNEDQKGGFRYNKDIVKEVGEEFDLYTEHLKGTVNSVNISDKISSEELEYFLPDYRKIANYLNDDGTIQPMDIIRKYGYENGEVLQERYLSNIYFVVLDITYSSYSEWVQETSLAPACILYLNEYDDRLELIGIEDNSGYYSDTHVVSLYGMDCTYYSNWFYDFDTQKNDNCTAYPMIDGEEITVKVGYIVPEIFLDKMYIWYTFSNSIENTYNNKYDVLVKLT